MARDQEAGGPTVASRVYELCAVARRTCVCEARRAASTVVEATGRLAAEQPVLVENHVLQVPDEAAAIEAALVRVK